MTECSNCGATIQRTTSKNLKGRTHSKAVAKECPECGHKLEKTERSDNPNLLNK